MGQGLRVSDVVDGDDLEIVGAERGAEDIAPDASEAVDAYLNRHRPSRGLRAVAARRWTTRLYMESGMLGSWPRNVNAGAAQGNWRTRTTFSPWKVTNTVFAGGTP